MFIFSIARNTQREFGIVGGDANTVAVYGFGEVLSIHKNGAFEAAPVAKTLDALDILEDGKWKLQREGHEAKNELHRKDLGKGNIGIDPMLDPSVKRLV